MTARVTVDLSTDTGRLEGEDLDRLDRRALQYLPQVPDGATLVVKVGNRDMLMPSAIGWLSNAARRLNVEIDATTPHAARRWYDAITSGGIE